MPTVAQRYTVNVYRHASLLPPSVWEAFRQRECDCNVVYPHALKSRAARDGEDTQMWITCSTLPLTASAEPTVDLVLSCTSGILGSYPVFIFVNAPSDDLDDNYLHPRLDSIVRVFQGCVHHSRVFSVFAPELAARIFATLWWRYTGIHPYEEPYYAARLAYCTPSTVTRQRMTVFADLSYVPRLACKSDISAVAELCQGFADTSKPFTLTARTAHREARYLIEHKLLWVLEVHRPGKPNDIASIVAVTRSSTSVAGITKVFTSPCWRKRGCAERLVRHVCQRLLSSQFSTVVLYVAHNNMAAAGVYHRVGFRGLAGSLNREGGGDNWLELGFDRNFVHLGHW